MGTLMTIKMALDPRYRETLRLRVPGGMGVPIRRYLGRAYLVGRRVGGVVSALCSNTKIRPNNKTLARWDGWRLPFVPRLTLRVHSLRV